MENRIKELRESLGWSQKDVADRAGTTQANIQRYETGASEMKVAMAFAVAAALGVTIETLYGIEIETDEVVLTDEERKVLDFYRSANRQGKIAIQAVAAAMSNGKGGLSVTISADD